MNLQKLNEAGINVIALPFESCLAKTYVTPTENLKGRTVFNHCQIVGEVARKMLDTIPVYLREQIFPLGSELAVAAHDIGKVSPTFQEKILRGTTGYSYNSKPELKNIDPDLEKTWGGHAGVSQAAAIAVKSGKYIPEILGQHHGYSPALNNLATDAVFGGKAWQDERIKLIEALKQTLQCEWPKIDSENQALAIAGLTSVADWIGSGPFFENPESDWRPNIQAALDNAGFISPALKSGLSFFDIFGFYPKDTQTKLIDAVNFPGVYILEAPMGLGKTEAALYAAYQIIEKGMATGLYFALPTQLTSNVIHDRVNAFLESILMEESSHKQALLLHGNAWLKEMGEEGQPGGSWFHNSKRGILAPFAVGTIDQALMAVMNVKHGFVRAFGLSGKVVILDEVHTYDAYTGTLLDALVKQLVALHCTVIILSATLTKERREKFTQKSINETAYPLITAFDSVSLQFSEIKVDHIPDRQVQLQLQHKDQLAIEEALLRAEQGQQVLWIENTVADAQAMYQLFAARSQGLNINCGLLHSRFLKTDRANNENEWVRLYGKDAADDRNKSGRILVGTQVLEQSLDIDADFLVSRFCPTDMLLQRLGRLWRHENTIRPIAAKREAWLLAPEANAAIKNPEKEFGKTAFVYSPYVLCRSLEVWCGKTIIYLPGDIRTMIEATYQPRQEVGEMQDWYHELQKGSKKRKGIEQLQSVALVGLSKGGKTLPENKASTRYSEQDSIDCLLVKAIKASENKQETVITLLNNETIELPKNGKKLNKKLWRELAATLSLNTVTVSEYLAPDALPLAQLEWLKDYVYLGSQHNEEDRIRIGVVQANGEIKSMNMGEPSTKYVFNYDALLGYQAIKKNKENE